MSGGLNQGKRWGKKKGLDDCGPSSLDQVIKYSSGTHSASAAKLVKGVSQCITVVMIGGFGLLTLLI